MNRITLFKKTVFLCLISIGIYGQNQSKTYKETFNVGDDTVLEIKTSHADIEFETWDKNEVVIEATVELSDISDEDAERYFEKNRVEIMGNSEKIEVSTGGGNSLFTPSSFGNLDFHFEMPEMPEIPEMIELFEIEAMYPLPPLHFHRFDHEAYKKDGKEYMKKWQEEFSKGFDKEYGRKIEEWGKRMEERAERLEKRREERADRMEERAQRNADRAEERAERMKEVQEKRQAIMVKRAEMRKRRDSTRFLFIDSDGNRSGGSNIFYFNSDGREGNIKVKKTIKIKMPKSLKMKMNVRHGEVKLAENVKNLKATLSHARLFASTIEGDDTTIIASYSPVSVQNWNYGHLQADYSENVNLKEVGNLILKSTSSDITIDRLVTNLNASNSFGPIHIKSISKNFKDLDVSLSNAELTFDLPMTAFDIQVNGTTSKLTTPASLTLSKTKNGHVIVNKGYHIKTDSGKSIKINSKYSEVVVR